MQSIKMRSVLLMLFTAALLSGCSIAARLGELTGFPMASGGDGPGSLSMLGRGVAEAPQNLPKSRSGNPPVYEVFGQQYRVMDSSAGYRERGLASWYGSKFHGRNTSSGEVYNMYNMTAAHKSLPLPTFVEVVNLQNGRSITVKVNDRGPFVDDRIIDLSYAAAAQLGVLDHGTVEVEVTAISVNTDDEVPLAGTPASQQTASPVVIQVGAFSDRSRAETMRARVDDVMQVNAAYIVPTDDTSLFKVRFGVDSSVPLDELLAHLDAAGIRKYTVIDR